MECDEGSQMDDAGADLKMLRAHMDGIGARLDGNWSEKLDTQLHLDQDSAECAYWHAGYYQALADVLSLMAKPRANADIADRSNPLRAAGQGAGNFQSA
jgi:hypothetical protein